MKTKLTLSLDKAIIEKSRNVAKKEHKSLSALVEELLKGEVEKDTAKQQEMIDKLHGIFGKTSVVTNWKEEIRKAASEKHDK